MGPLGKLHFMCTTQRPSRKSIAANTHGLLCLRSVNKHASLMLAASHTVHMHRNKHTHM